MIFKETILLESAAALPGLVDEGSGAAAAATGAKEERDAGEAGADEAGAAVRVVEVEADIGDPDIAVNGAAVEADDEVGTAITVKSEEADEEEADSD